MKHNGNAGQTQIFNSRKKKLSEPLPYCVDKILFREDGTEDDVISIQKIEGKYYFLCILEDKMKAEFDYHYVCIDEDGNLYGDK